MLFLFFMLAKNFICVFIMNRSSLTVLNIVYASIKNFLMLLFINFFEFNLKPIQIKL